MRKIQIVTIANVVMVAMTYKTINLKPETYERLILYKHGNTTFDEVLNQLLDMIREEDFYRKVLEEHRSRMARIKSGEHARSSDLDEALADI